MGRWVTMLVVLASCSDPSSAPPPPQPPSHPPPPPPPRQRPVPTYGEAPELPPDAPLAPLVSAQLRLRAGKATPGHGEALQVAFVGGEPRLVDGAELRVDSAGTVAVPAGTRTTGREIASRATASGVLVIADAAAPVGDLLPFLFEIRGECWAFATATTTALSGTWPAPCPPQATTAKDGSELALWIVPGLIAIGVAPARTFEDLIPNALAGKLRDHKRMPAFAKRVDLSYALDPRVPVGEVVDALAAIHASGFTAARWIPAAWLPMRFAGGVGSDPIVWQPPPPPPPAVTIAIASVEGKLPSDRTALQIDRVINARAGVFRACYQKELNRTPKLEGTLAVTFQLTDTAVTSATSTGTLRNPGVEACVNSNVMRLRFPAGTPAKLTTTFKFSTTP